MDEQDASPTAPAAATAPAAKAARRQGAFERISAGASDWTGRNTAFGCAVALVVGWIVSGPIFHYSDRWVFFINTSTSVVTFLMVFLIQRAQNKHTLALQLKVNELLAAHKHANNSLIAIEGLSEDELRRLDSRFVRLGSLARDSGAPPSRVNVDDPEGPARRVDAD